ncbi:MAG: histidine phosphatase family protein [Casimicrobiaceae bacterium]
MADLYVLRHATTSWNELGRMQGRRDIPLSAAGRAELGQWRAPEDLTTGATWLSSPLARAVDTAAALGGVTPRIERALIEMDWGAWEGATLPALRARHGNAFTANADRGLDFRPPGGESPREVLARVEAWVRRQAADDQTAIAVTHKGVMRALLVAATGWNMLGPPPARFEHGCLQHFTIAADGSVMLMRCNVPLTADPVRKPR